MAVVVIQSFRTENVPSWITSCMASVQHWCETKGYTWHFVGNELFDRVPDWYLDKTGFGPVAADYARLVLLQEALADGHYSEAIWLDADTCILDDSMAFAPAQSCAFGQEFWVQEEGGILRVRKNVHNAACVFKQGCVVLPFLAETVASIIRRANPDHIAPQMVGPKLLSALHSLYAFDLLPQAGALSPAVIDDLVAGGGPALSMMLEKTPVPLQCVNLCASLVSKANAHTVLDNLHLLRC